MLFVGTRQSIPSGERKGWGKARQPVPFCYSLPLFYPCFLSLCILLFLPSPAPSLLLPFPPSQPHQQRSRSRLSPAHAELPQLPRNAQPGMLSCLLPQHEQQLPKSSPTACPFRLHRGQADSGSQDSPRGTGALIQILFNYSCSAGQDQTLFSVKPTGTGCEHQGPP